MTLNNYSHAKTSNMAKQTAPAAQTQAAETKVKTGKVRFSYAHVFEPTKMDENSKAKYSVSILIKKSDTATVEAIKAAIEAAKVAGLNSKFGGKYPANLKQPLRDGDVERADDPNYAGCWFLNASTNDKPGIVGPSIGGQKPQPIYDTTEFYSGCYGRATINMYPFNTAGSKGVAAGLNNLQKLEDGPALAGRTAAEDDFSDGEGTVDDDL